MYDKLSLIWFWMSFSCDPFVTSKWQPLKLVILSGRRLGTKLFTNTWQLRNIILFRRVYIGTDVGRFVPSERAENEKCDCAFSFLITGYKSFSSCQLARGVALATYIYINEPRGQVFPKRQVYAAKVSKTDCLHAKCRFVLTVITNEKKKKTIRNRQKRNEIAKVLGARSGDASFYIPKNILLALSASEVRFQTCKRPDALIYTWNTGLISAARIRVHPQGTILAPQAQNLPRLHSIPLYLMHTRISWPAACE